MWNWAEVKCNCTNRHPLQNADLRGAPHGFHVNHRKHLSRRKKQEVEEWEKNIYGMYQCGHRDGLLVRTGSDLRRIGRVIIRAFKDHPDQFKMFCKLEDAGNYENERLSLSRPEVASWKNEIEMIKRFTSAEESMPSDAQKVWKQKLNEYGLTEASLKEALTSGEELCRVSLDIGNPIEFYH